MLRRAGLALVLFWVASVAAWARTTPWIPVGFEGARTAALVHDAQRGRLYAGAVGAGAFASDDGARTWQRLDGLGDRRVLALVLASDGRLYAGTADEGVLASADGGATWQAARTGLPEYGLTDGRRVHATIRALAASASAPARLYALAGSHVYRSEDAGASWTFASGGIDNPWDVEGRLAVDPQDEDRVYLARHSYNSSLDERHWFYVSGDGGRTWQPSEAGLVVEERDPRALYVSPSDPATLYLGLESRTGGGPILYRSRDRGASWEAASSGLPPATLPTAIGALLETPDGLYAGSGTDYCAQAQGLFHSADAGTSWTLLSGALAGVSVSALVTDGTELYAATGADEPGSYGPRGCGRGVFRSLDGGASWQAANRGLASSTVTAVALDPGNADHYYAATGDGGLFHSPDAGASWTSIRGNLPRAYPIVALEALAGNPPALLAVVTLAPDAAGLYRSDDRGLSWQALLGQAPGRLPSQETYVALRVLGPNHFVLAGKSGFYETTDGGASWAERSEGLVADAGGFAGLSDLDDSGLGTRPLALGTAGQGVFVRESAGAAWEPRSSGLPASPAGASSPYRGVQSVRWDRYQPAWLYAGLQSAGLYKSGDAGLTWAQRSAGLPAIPGGGSPARYNAVSVLGQRPEGTLLAGHLYSEGFFTGLYRSEDDGLSWTASNAGVPRASVTALTMGGPFEARVLLGTDGAGLVHSRDGGLTFEPVSTFSSLTPELTALAVDANDPSRIWIGSTERGVYRSLDGGASFEPASEGLGDPRILSLATNATSLVPSGLKVYAGTQTGLYVTEDLGDTWEAVVPGLPGGPVVELLTAGGADPNTVAVWAAVQGQGLHVLRAPVATFEPVGLAKDVTSLTRDAATGQVHAGTASEGVFVSPDGLGNWTSASAGLPQEALEVRALDRSAPAARQGVRDVSDLLWLGARRGVYRRGSSARRGTEPWTSLGLAGEEVRSLQYIGSTDTVYAATDQGIWRLEAASRQVDGSGWVHVVAGLSAEAAQSLRRFEVVPTRPGGSRSLLGATGDGLFVLELSASTVPAQGRAALAASMALVPAILLWLVQAGRARPEPRRRWNESPSAEHPRAL